MKDPNARDALVAAIAQWPEAQVPMSLLQDGEILPARWSFAELYDWSVYLQRELRPELPLLSWDIQEATNRLEVGLDAQRQGQVAVMARRLQELRVPCHLIAYRLERVAWMVGRRLTARSSGPGP